MLGFTDLLYLLEFAQVHIHWVRDAIKPSYPLLPSSFAFNLSQNQVFHSLLQWTTFCQNSPLWPICLGWPCTAWHIASLNYTSPFATTKLWSLSWEDPLEEEMVTPSSILAWKIPWTEECGRLQSTGSQSVGHNSAQRSNKNPRKFLSDVRSFFPWYVYNIKLLSVNEY